MSMIQVNWKPDVGELRKFGYISLAAFTLIGVWLLLRHSIFGIALSEETARTAAYACWGIAALSLAGSVAAPAALRPLYVGLTAISLPIGFVVSHALMAAVFYGMLTPIGLVFRLMGRDALQRQFDRSASTYWQPRVVVQDRAQYFKQY